MLKRGQVIKGRRAIPSPHARDWYARRMKLLVQVMDGRMRIYFNKTGETLTPSDREELARLRVRFTNLFGEEARPMATAFFNKNITYTKASFRAATKPIVEATEEDLRERKRKAMAKQTRFQIKLNAKTDKLELSQFEDAIEDNVNLIKTIPSKYFDKIGKAVELRTVGKMSRGALVKRIKELGGVTQRRAELIADDQTAKVTERMMLARCRNAGIKRVMWLHSSISMHPRDVHRRKWDGHTGKFNRKPNGFNGYIFDIDKPPYDPVAKQYVYPAQLPNCKCTLIPVISV